jgi:hypothetical protein
MIDTNRLPRQQKIDIYQSPAETAKFKISRRRILTPITIMVVDTLGLKKAKALVKVLLDPGTTNTLISRKALPREEQEFTTVHPVPNVHLETFEK